MGTRERKKSHAHTVECSKYDINSKGNGVFEICTVGYPPN